MTYSHKKPILLLHNGNSRVKNLIATKFEMKVANCIADIPNKVDFFKSNTNVVADLTCADELDDHKLLELSEHCHIVKALTSHEDDLKNLEPIYSSSYDEEQWMRATMKRFWVAHEIIWIGDWQMPTSVSKPKISFTMGRCGSHVISSVTNTEFLHHWLHLIGDKDLFSKLVDAEHIYTACRAKFFNYLCSSAIGRKTDYVSQTEENEVETDELIKSVEKFELTYSNFEFYISSMVNFVDMLLFLKIVYNKSISLTLYEELSDHYGKISFKKNSYKYEDLIENIEEFRSIAEERYQPVYQHAMNQMIRHCGKTLL
jgi:hypothetical protein